MSRSYEIKERPANLGGGWVLTMFEDGLMRLNLSLKPYSLRLKPMVRAGSPFPPINRLVSSANDAPSLGAFFCP